MRRAIGWATGGACLLVIAACGAKATGEPTSESGQGSSTSGSTGAGSESTPGEVESESASDPSMTTDPDSGPMEGTDDGLVFVLRPDGGGPGNECDPRVQDCPRGQKCTAWANDGGTFWNANKCVDVIGQGVGGDACMVEGSGVAGIDDCDIGHVCLNTNARGVGACVEFCQGDNEDCGVGDVCAVYNDGVLPICLVGCDPLLQDCPEGQGCIDTPNNSFICFNDASGDQGADGDVCPADDGENSCDPGMWCGANSNGCDSVNCCTPYCDLDDPQCPMPDVCTSFFGDAGSAPPGFENVGVCVLP